MENVMLDECRLQIERPLATWSDEQKLSRGLFYDRMVPNLFSHSPRLPPVET